MLSSLPRVLLLLLLNPLVLHQLVQLLPRHLVNRNPLQLLILNIIEHNLRGLPWMLNKKGMYEMLNIFYLMSKVADIDILVAKVLLVIEVGLNLPPSPTCILC